MQMIKEYKPRLVLSLIITIVLFSYLNPPSVSAEIIEGTERIFLKIEDERIESGDIDSAPSYTHVFEYNGKIGIDYRFFYPVNGPLGGSAGYHEGDWEGVKVIIDKEAEEIIQIKPSAHGSENGWLNPSEFSFTNGRFNVYSAKYSHANYPTIGTHTRKLGGVDFILPDDHTNKGPLWDIKNKIALLPNSDTSEHPWMDFKGYWGATGSEVTPPFDPGALIGTESPKFGLGNAWFRNEAGASNSSEITDLVVENRDLAMYYARQFAPNVYLHDEDPYGPSSVEAFLAASSLNKYYVSSLAGSLVEITEELIPKGSVNKWSLVGKEMPPVYPIELEGISNDGNIMEVDWSIIQPLGSANTLTLKREKLYPDGVWRYTNYDVTGLTHWEKESDWDTDYRVTLFVENQDKVLYETPVEYYTMPAPPAPENVTSQLVGDESSGFGIKLRWDEVPLASQSHQFGINGYVVYRDGKEIGRVTSDQTSFTDFDVVKEQTYNYELKSEGVRNKLSANATSLSAGIYFIDNTWIASSVRGDLGVFLYKDNNYLGEYIKLEPGEYPSLADIPLGDVTANNCLSSMAINYNYRVTVFEDEDFKGGSHTFNYNDESFSDENLNDKISSIIIEDTQEITMPTVSVSNSSTDAITLTIDSPVYEDLTIEDYVIERDGKRIERISLDAEGTHRIQFIDDTVEPNKQYTYRVHSMYSYDYENDGWNASVLAQSYKSPVVTAYTYQNLVDSNFMNFNNWRKNSVDVDARSIMFAPDGSFAQTLTPSTINGKVSLYDIDINQKGNKYTFGVWMKADVPHEAQIKIQNTSNTESTGAVVEVTNSWKYFTITTENAFTTDDGLTLVIWPGKHNGTTHSVHASGPNLYLKN
ncbi:Vps62-related protein [Bacillus spongiae]|uniref:Vps62-related protein n=1 Tax=Bacillus spongiae TaxID=2683610 RepID=A0ABU8HBP9_9BACI